MRDQKRPGDGLPWRTRPRRPPRPIEAEIRREPGGNLIDRAWNDIVRPGRLVAIVGEEEDQ